MLRAHEISVRLGARKVLDRISVDLQPGQMVAVIGPNGAGKSTLLKTLAGLLSHHSGTLSYNGEALETFDARCLGRTIAYLPQDRHVYWPVTARTIVALGRMPHRASIAGLSAADHSAIDAAMTAMDVAALAERPVVALSGGELARVLVARALAQETPYLLADEPAAGLDPAHALSLFMHLERLTREGRCIVVALHDLSLALRFCDRALLLKDGSAVAEGPPRAVLTGAQLAAVYGIDAVVDVINGIPVVVPVAPLT